MSALNSFFEVVFTFFQEMFTYALIAIFLENTIFSRALGTSTALYVIRKKYNIFLFGGVMTLIMAAASVLTYLVYPFLKGLSFSYYIVPPVFVAIIGVVYVGALLLTRSLVHKRREEILQLIHVSAFNCAVLGALLLATGIPFAGFGVYLGFGVGSAIGFTFAAYLISIASERLNSEDIPPAFRGFPITLIYIGIISLALYGLIGHTLPF